MRRSWNCRREIWEIRSGRTSKIGTARCDLLTADTFDPALNAAASSMGSFDTVIVTAAHFASQGHLEDDERACRDLLLANFTNTLLFCEKARKRLLSTGGGTLCVLSSVAGERGRKPVVLYGATKAGLSAYLEGLDHKFRGEGAGDDLRQARIRKNRHDRESQPTAVCRRAGGSGPRHRAGDRSREAGDLHPRDMALGDDGHSESTSLRDEAYRLLAPWNRGPSPRSQSRALP